MKNIISISIFILIANLTFAQTEKSTYKVVADEFEKNYNINDVEAIFLMFSSDMKIAVPLDKLTPFLTNLKSQAGNITKREFITYKNGSVAVYKTNFERALYALNISIDNNSKIDGFAVTPFRDNKLPKIERNITKLILPFKGEWTVFWGGDTKGLNYHVISEAEKNKSRSVKQLVSNPKFSQAVNLTKILIEENMEHPKLLELKDIIEQKILENEKIKIMVFSQYRDSVTLICKELNSLKNVSAKVFVGQTKKEDSGLSQKEQQKIIRDFSNGDFNVLCSTSIGEEGLDIPEVNAVIFYEPVPSAIRKIQRAGRTARLMPGEIIMLVTKNTRDEAYYWSAIRKEKSMHTAIESIKEDLENNIKTKQKILF